MDDTKRIELRLIALVQKFLSELSEERVVYVVTLSASIEKDFGIGSLEKAELLNRIEKDFLIQLPETTLTESKTLKDLFLAIQQAKPARIIEETIAPHLTATQVNPSGAKTLIDVLLSYVNTEPDRPHIYFQDAAGHEEIMTYGQLFSRSQSIAAGLQQQGLKPGDTVAIMLPTSLNYFPVFFGILLANCIPVPIYPPFHADQIEAYIKREATTLNNAEIKLLITFERVELVARLLKPFIPSLMHITTAEALSITTGDINFSNATENNIALIQYTSGSTGNPKGVVLTHYNLLTNIRAYGKAAAITPQDVCVSWLPLYHDMGLIGSWLGSFYFGIPLVLLSPVTFLVRPERWLWAIHTHRGTISAAPNFAYELCVQKIDSTLIQGLDLSSWRLACNGAEAVLSETMEHFFQKFSPYGFKKNALLPGYGLAECALVLTVPELNRPYRIDYISREILEKKQRAAPIIDSDKKRGLEFIACGKPILNHAIRIVDSDNNVLPERHVGQLQFKGPSAMQGYYHNSAATQSVFHEDWCDTGDMAYIADGELFITGRQKDVIIKAGHNFYPESAEAAASTVPGIIKGCVIAFGVRDPKRGTEKFIIAAETDKKKKEAQNKIINAVREKVLAALSIPPDDIILISPSMIPKTASGKLQRSHCKQAYLSGKLRVHQKSAWWQLSTIFLIGIIQKIKNVLSTVLRFFYTGYIAIILILHLPFIYFTILFSSHRRARIWARFWARCLFFCIAIPIRVQDKKYLMQNKPCVFVANHASYIDAGVLLATLPTDTVFVGKKELLKVPLLKTLLGKLKFHTLDREDWTQSQTEVTELSAILNSGSNLALFPEGGFENDTGLRPFKAGAFKVAVETHTAICPIAMRGTRHFLRGDKWMPTWGKIDVIVFEPIKPQDNNWQEVLRLRQLTYQMILKECGEMAAGPYNAN